MTSMRDRSQALRTLPQSGPSSWLGVRTLSSKPFRLILALMLLVFAVVFLTARLSMLMADPELQYGIDFRYWYEGAVAVREGQSPYPARYFTEPVPVTDFGYKYPPTFAQSLGPLTALGLPEARHFWATVQVVAGFLSVWLAGVMGGTRRSFEFLVWAAVAFAWFYPFFDTIHKGNVSAVQALQVSLLLGGGAVAGISLTSAVLLKTTPLAIVPAALFHGGRLRRALLVSAVLAAVASVLMSPRAWQEFLLIQPNLTAGSYVVDYNFHPAGLAATAFRQAPVVADVIRLVTLAVAAAALLASLYLARRNEGWPAAVVLGVTAMLLVPGAIWYHYFAVLLPLAAFSWPRASSGQRFALVLCSVGIIVGILLFPLATLSAAALLATTFTVVAPRPLLPRRLCGAGP